MNILWTILKNGRKMTTHPSTDGQTDGREYHIPRLIANGDGGE